VHIDQHVPVPVVAVGSCQHAVIQLGEMPPTGPPTEQEIWKIARRTTDIIEQFITSDVCVFGGAASSLWANIGRVPKVCGTSRFPVFLTPRSTITQDIDIVVCADDLGLTAEDIKELIAREDDRYFLEASRRLNAAHQILYCRLPGWAMEGRRVKVDILVPPTLGLPEVRSYDVVYFNGTPVMPLFDLLVMKTQGWWDHHTSSRADFRAKVSADVGDIHALLDRADTENLSYDDEADEYRHGQEFMDNALDLIQKFISMYREGRRWRRLGFPV
jgi:hypothetical protein